MLGLDRFFEDADDDPISAESASRGVIFDRYREFSALARRLEADEKSLGMATHSQELEASWERRSQLARELVDTPAPAIADVVFKMTIVSSLVAEGEVRLGLTQQCVEECERALAVETVAEQCFMAPAADASSVQLWAKDSYLCALLSSLGSASNHCNPYKAFTRAFDCTSGLEKPGALAEWSLVAWRRVGTAFALWLRDHARRMNCA